MKPLLRVDSIKSCFRIRLDRKSKNDRKLHDKSDASVFSWEGRDDEATGVLQTEGDNEHDIRHSADEGRVQTLTAQGVPSFEGTSLEKSSNETKTTATTAVRGRVKGLFAPMFRAITMKNQRMPEVKKRHVEELSIKTNDVEQHPVEESENMVDEAVHGVKSRSLPEDIQNQNTSCEREEATGDEVGIFSILGQDETEKSEIMNVVESQGLDEKKLEGFKDNNIQRASIPSAELPFTPEEESRPFLPVTTEQNSSGKTMECRTPASTSSPFAAQKIPPSPKACDLSDDIMSPRTDSQLTKNILIGQNTNCTPVKSHSTKEGSAFTTENCETSSAKSLPPPNEAIPSFSRTSNSSGSVVHDISFSKELDHDASSDNMKVCRDAEQVIVKSLQSKKKKHEKSHAITQEEPMPVTFDEERKCTVLSKEKTDVSTFSPPTVQTCDSASTVNPTPKYDTEDNTVSKDTGFTIAKGKVDHHFKGSKIPITRAVSDSAAKKLSSQEAEAAKAYRLARPLSWSGHYKSYKPIVFDEDDDSSYVTHLSGIDEDGPFDSSRCGLSDDMHDALIWWGERIYKTFGEPGDKTKETMLDMMRSSEEAAYVVRDLSQLKF
ncbi:hypothetical protein HJC23_000859 [Cyclotella cryptica]|uniref:Uncharacterized protein n=1 Tax=Cyclotella cryptica TaxID=29204 RepID=A0ABD3PU01_9STRA|eukprot:CCRYP_011564-RA/>CCRYP_011564-RA protein AED:0.35 eAED:0.35 QI:0/-1/0/1/-1/1/1/0/605